MEFIPRFFIRTFARLKRKLHDFIVSTHTLLDEISRFSMQGGIVYRYRGELLFHPQNFILRVYRRAEISRMETSRGSETRSEDCIIESRDKHRYLSEGAI